MTDTAESLRAIAPDMPTATHRNIVEHAADEMQRQQQHPLTLHQATEELRALLDQVNPDDGSMPEGFEPARALVERKAVAVTSYILESERQAGYLKDYASELAERAKTIERRAEWLKRYLAEHMKAAGIDSICDERKLFEARLYPGRDIAVEVDPTAAFPLELCNPPAKPTPSKAKLRAAIEAGQPISGARLVRRDRLVIR